MRSGIFFWVFLVVLIVLGRAAIGAYIKERESRRLAVDSQARLVELEERERELNEHINFLKTPEGVEAELRSRYSVAKPGETVVLIVDDRNATTTKPVKKSWWQKFISFFENQ